jgi:hypothetical protein
MLSARETRQLREIAARLQVDDPALARRLVDHGIRPRTSGGAQPWVWSLLRALTALAVSLAAIVLMGFGLELHRPVLVVAGATLMAVAPFVPLLRRRGRAPASRRARRWGREG